MSEIPEPGQEFENWKSPETGYRRDFEPPEVQYLDGKRQVLQGLPAKEKGAYMYGEQKVSKTFDDRYLVPTGERSLRDPRTGRAGANELRELTPEEVAQHLEGIGEQPKPHLTESDVNHTTETEAPKVEASETNQEQNQEIREYSDVISAELQKISSQLAPDQQERLNDAVGKVAELINSSQPDKLAMSRSIGKLSKAVGSLTPEGVDWQEDDPKIVAQNVSPEKVSAIATSFRELQQGGRAQMLETTSQAKAAGLNDPHGLLLSFYGGAINEVANQAMLQADFWEEVKSQQERPAQPAISTTSKVDSATSESPTRQTQEVERKKVTSYEEREFGRGIDRLVKTIFPGDNEFGNRDLAQSLKGLGENLTNLSESRQDPEKDLATFLTATVNGVNAKELSIVPDNEDGLTRINDRRYFLGQLRKEVENLGDTVANAKKDQPEAQKRLLSMTASALRWLEQQDQILAETHRDLDRKYKHRLWQ